jgi:Tol biopolymer transport system component
MQLRYGLLYSIPVRILILGLALFIAGVQAHAQIAFTSRRDGNYEIYVMDANGRNPRNLTRNPELDWWPSWPPSGGWIAFTSDRDGGTFDVYVMDVKGGNPRNLTNSRTDDAKPSWSPSGGHIAFESDRDRNWEIYVMEADGGNPKKLTKDAERDEFADWSRAVLSVSPAGRQLTMWGWLKGEDRDEALTIPNPATQD